jgi:alpha-1,6-mannosyltransferase
MTKIVQIANFFGPKSGGLKTSMIELAKQYSSRDIKCLQIIPGIDLTRTTNSYADVITLPSWKIPFSGGYRMIIKTGEIKKILTDFSPDVIEINDRLTLIGIAPWANQRGIKTILFAHEILTNVLKAFFPFIPNLSALVARHNRKTFRKFDYVIATTKFAAQEFKSVDANNLVIVPLGVDSEIFNENSADLDLKTHTSFPKLVLCSRLSKEKNPEIAFKVVRELVAQGLNPRLYVIGAGPLKNKLMKKYKNLPIDFVGYIKNRSEVAKYLASADVVLAPGPNETFCLAALEALACGTPVIASEKSALKEILVNGGGAYVDDQIENWVESVCVISTNPENRKRALENSRNYSWHKTANQLLELYQVSQLEKELVA